MVDKNACSSNTLHFMFVAHSRMAHLVERTPTQSRVRRQNQSRGEKCDWRRVEACRLVRARSSRDRTRSPWSDAAVSAVDACDHHRARGVPLGNPRRGVGERRLFDQLAGCRRNEFCDLLAHFIAVARARRLESPARSPSTRAESATYTGSAPPDVPNASRSRSTSASESKQGFARGARRQLACDSRARDMTRQPARPQRDSEGRRARQARWTAYLVAR